MTWENKKIIADIIPPERRVFIRPADPVAKNEEKEIKIKKEIKIVPLPPKKKRKKINFKHLFWITSVFVGVFFAGFLNARVEVSIAPKRVSLQIDKNITAVKNLAISKEHTIAFRTISVPYSKSEIFKATEKKSQDTKARGLVVIFNKQKISQVLVASTRLEDPAGKIYRIPSTVVIPAGKETGGKFSPGSKEVTVIADKVGAEYNIGLSDFTLPGLKDSPKFDLVFARSKTEMSGGGSGESVFIGAKDGDEAIFSLISRAVSNAGVIISKKLPENEFLLVNTIEYHSVKTNFTPQLGSVSDTFEAAIEGELRASIINKKELERAMLFGQKEIEALGKDSFIKNLNEINFKDTGYDFDGQTFGLYASGKVEAEHFVDADDIKKILAEKKLYDAASILSTFPGLSRAEVSIKPFWAGFWPDTIGRVDIILEGS